MIYLYVDKAYLTSNFIYLVLKIMKEVQIVFGAIVLLFLILVIIPQLMQVPQMGSSWRKDEKLIPTLQEISRFVPSNETVISSGFDPVLLYFTGHEIKVPHNVFSLSSLVDYMQEENYTYVLTIEGQYSQTHLDITFNGSQLYLAKNFREIATYKTDFNTLHLYKRV